MTIISTQEWTQELEARRAAVRAIVAQNQCDLLLIYGGWGHAEPFRYLTNFSPVLGDAYAVVTSANVASVVDVIVVVSDVVTASGDPSRCVTTRFVPSTAAIVPPACRRW